VCAFLSDQANNGGSGIASVPVTAKPLVLVTGLALAIRLYLSLTNFCISGDGVAYLTMARQFASGDAVGALGAVFSPLYPLLIVAMHVVVPDWELAGNLVSALLGTAAVVSIYAMTREAFGRNDLALGAAGLAAVHPGMAAFSASVRTEAGYIFLITSGVALMLHGLRLRRLVFVGAAGVLYGLAYLYRSEAIGLPVVAIAAIIAHGFVLYRNEFKRALAAAGILTIGFLPVASPYLLYLRASTGQWTVGREFTAAMMYGMGDAADNSQEWRRRGYSTHISALTPVFAEPKLYLEKVGNSLVTSSYNFVQALDPLLTILLVAGLWRRGRALLKNFAELFFAGLVLFYFCGFALSYTGTRFMIHLVPFTLGWVALGAESASALAVRWVGAAGWRLPDAAIPLTVALSLLPRTLWPIGYDMRGIRYAGEAISRREAKPRDVIAVDGRVAWYARARFIALPESRPMNLCGWIESQASAGYLMLNDRDERRYRVSPATACLQLIGRYPRGSSGRYDLFALVRAEKAKP